MHTSGEERFGAFPERGGTPRRRFGCARRKPRPAPDVPMITRRGLRRRLVTVSHLAVVFSLLIWMVSGGALADEPPGTEPPSNEATTPTSSGSTEPAIDMPTVPSSETTVAPSTEATEAGGDPSTVTTEANNSPQTTVPQGTEATEATTVPSAETTEAPAETTEPSSTEPAETTELSSTESAETTEAPDSGTSESPSTEMPRTDPDTDVSGVDVPVTEATIVIAPGEPPVTDTTVPLAETVSPDPATTVIAPTALLAETVSPDPATTVIAPTAPLGETVSPDPATTVIAPGEPTTVTDATAPLAETVSPDSTVATEVRDAVARLGGPLEAITNAITDALTPFTEAVTNAITDGLAPTAQTVTLAITDAPTPFTEALTNAITDALAPTPPAVTVAITDALEPITHALADAVTMVVDAMRSAANSPHTGLDVTALINLLKSTVPPDLPRIAEQMVKEVLAIGAGALREIITSTGVPSQAVQGVGLALAAHYAAVLNSGGPGANRFKDPAEGRRTPLPDSSGRFLHRRTSTLTGCDSSSGTSLQELLFAFPLPLNRTVPSTSRLLKLFSDRLPGPLFFSFLEQPG